MSLRSLPLLPHPVTLTYVRINVIQADGVGDKKKISDFERNNLPFSTHKFPYRNPPDESEVKVFSAPHKEAFQVFFSGPPESGGFGYFLFECTGQPNQAISSCHSDYRSLFNGGEFAVKAQNRPFGVRGRP